MGIGPLRFHRAQRLAAKQSERLAAEPTEAPAQSALIAGEQRQGEQLVAAFDRSDKHRRNGR